MAEEGQDVQEVVLTEPVEDQDPVIELGDRIRVNGGKYDKTTGRVVYRTVDELHLIPDGLTNRQIEFNLTEDGFDEESGIESVEILQKRKKKTFVEILDLHVGENLETFGSDGEPVETYKIKQVDPVTDTITITKNDDEFVVHFNFRGVPSNMPFRVARGKVAPELEVQDEEAEEVNEDKEVSEEVEEEVDFAFLDDELEAPADDSEEILIEIPTSERTYSNQTQKTEAYTDFLSLNTPAKQKLAETQKSCRILTEMFFQIRAAILRTSEDGTPKGIKPSSLQTLIDALELRLLTLSRCVVDIDKILYHDISESGDPQPEREDGVRIQRFNDKITSANEYIESSPEMSGQKFLPFLNRFLNKYCSSWRESGEDGNKIAFQRDEEVFRKESPGSETGVNGYRQGLPNKKEGHVSVDDLFPVAMSIVRGLKATRVRSQVLQLGEEAAVKSYVLFPLLYAPSLSTLRQESLVSDIRDGLNSGLSMKEILKQAGEITDIPSASEPFLVSVDGGTLGNIPLRDYIKSMGLRLEGLGDLWPLQVLMGMRDREWTIDQYEVIKEIIKDTQNQVLLQIISQRDALSQLASQPQSVQGIQMVQDGPAIIQKLADEPLLKEIQDALKDQMPGFADSDILMVGMILRNHPDLAMAQLADQPAALTRSRMKYARQEYLKSLKEIQLKKQRVAFAGEPPEPITCSHIKPLAMIRKVKDDKQRLALLAKFLVTFQGTKDDSWVKCNVGDHNLLCMHELLQIYQFIRPGDVSALNKEIQLNFGGGQFQGFYICRNCGQPISELEYDTHLEFDDNGRPMMGRSELVDKDAITQEQIENLIGPLGDVDDPDEFDNETKKMIYNTAKEIGDRLFAPLELDDYILVVNRVNALIQQIPTRERYIKIQEAQRRGKAATVISITADYDVYINQAVVCATAVHMLLLIQTRKPDLILRGMPVGCRNLGGQPLDPEGGTNGIQCIISVISSFQRDAPPWSLTQFQKEPDDTVRQKTIMNIFEPILRAALQDPTILQALSQKREYIRKVLGAAGGQGRPSENLPDNFAPIPYAMTEEEFVEKIIIPEAATNADRAELWIRQGNVIAKKNKMPMPLAFTEASCCLAPLEKTDNFWENPSVKQSLPPFPRRTGVPAPPKITRTESTMKPSQISRPLPDPPENSYYQLFLKVCYDGEKKGYSHEFGLTHTCMWCNLKLQTDLALLTPEQGLDTIESQGIEVTKESFEDLLNETHRVNSFKNKFKVELPGPLDNWSSLMKLDPEPVIGYMDIMTKTQAELLKLPIDAKEVEIALALSDFSILAEKQEEEVKRRIPASQYSIIDSIVSGGAGSIIRFLHSYALVPISQFSYKQVVGRNIPKSWGLSWQHQLDLTELLSSHRGYLIKFNKIQITPWLKAKMDTFISQTRENIQILERIRPLQIPGGLQTYEYFLKFFFYSSLANLVDPNILPVATDAEAPASQVEQQALFPAKFISDMLNRFKEEGFNLTPEQIRELIAKRNEMEKTNILKKMTDMPRATKDIAKIQMKLGIGDWAVGGTKAIYAYDADRYDIERDQRAQAGIIDFPGHGPEGLGQNDQPDYFEAQGDEAGYIDDAELGDINGFDDDN